MFFSKVDEAQFFRSIDDAAARFTRGLAFVLLAIASLKLFMIPDVDMYVAGVKVDFIVRTSCLICFIFSSAWAVVQFLASYYSLRELVVQKDEPQVRPARWFLLCCMVIFSATVAIAIASAVFAHWPG